MLSFHGVMMRDFRYGMEVKPLTDDKRKLYVSRIRGDGVKQTIKGIQICADINRHQAHKKLRILDTLQILYNLCMVSIFARVWISV